jgi:nitrogen fixation NifU-like protein
LDRKERVAYLVEHFGNPRHKGVLEGADVQMPGGSPECGGSVTVYLKGDGNGGIEDLSWTGQGDTISMGATLKNAVRKYQRNRRTQTEESLAKTPGTNPLG